MPYADSDLVPVGMIAVAPSVIAVNPERPGCEPERARSPGRRRSPAASTGQRPAAEARRTSSRKCCARRASIITIVPYKSGAEGVTAVISNNVPATSEASIIVLPQVKAGKLKAIATTYTKRITAYNTLPTAKEQGFPGVEIGHWAGLFRAEGHAARDRRAHEQGARSRGEIGGLPRQDGAVGHRARAGTRRRTSSRSSPRSASASASSRRRRTCRRTSSALLFSARRLERGATEPLPATRKARRSARPARAARRACRSPRPPPSASTTMRSAMRTLEKRCEISTAVLPRDSSLNRWNTSNSARASSAAVGSSRISTCASRM